MALMIQKAESKGEVDFHSEGVQENYFLLGKMRLNITKTKALGIKPQAVA